MGKIVKYSEKQIREAIKKSDCFVCMPIAGEHLGTFSDRCVKNERRINIY